MKYYFIVSRLHGLVLDLENSGNKPVPRIVPWKRSAAPSQLWYDDLETGTIRNKFNNYCIDVESDVCIVKPYQEGDHNQQWERHDNHVRNRKNHSKVLDIFRSDTNPGAEVGPYHLNDGLNQQWDFDFVDDNPWNAGQRDPSINARRFYIVSELNQFVLDIKGCDSDEGTKIIMWPKNEDIQRNQLWYFDQHGYIRSDLNDMVFTSSEAGKTLKTKTYSPSDARGQWQYDEKTKKIYNRVGEALDIEKEDKSKGADLCSYQFKGSPNQLWRLQYV